MSTVGFLFPFLNDYNLVNPYKRIVENMKAGTDKLREFLKTSTDNESYYAQIKGMNKFTEDEIIGDLMILLFAGTDTTSHTAMSLMYYIGKYPHLRQRLKEEYEREGIITKEGLQRSKLTIQDLEECDYAEYFIKEAFRLNHTISVAYETIENVQMQIMKY